MTDGAIPKPPHIVRATVVLTTSDGTSHSYLLNGDEASECRVSYEVRYEEIRSLFYSDPIGRINPRHDYTFKLTDMLDPSGVMQGPAVAAAQQEIQQTPREVESGSDTSQTT